MTISQMPAASTPETPAPTVTATPAAIAAARPGWRTSEFWLSVLGIAGTLFAPVVDNMTSGATDRLSDHGAAGAIAAGVIVGAYTLARGLVKAAGARADAHTSSFTAAATVAAALGDAAGAIRSNAADPLDGYPDSTRH